MLFWKWLSRNSDMLSDAPMSTPRAHMRDSSDSTKFESPIMWELRDDRPKNCDNSGSLGSRIHVHIRQMDPPLQVDGDGHGSPCHVGVHLDFRGGPNDRPVDGDDNAT